MMRLSFVFTTLATLALGGFASPALAKDDIFLACKTRNPSSRDWVPKAVLIKIDSRTWRAAVLDEFTLQAFEGGAPATVSRPTPQRMKLTWKLIGVRDRQDKVQNVDFKMSINMKKMTFNYAGLGESFFVAPGSASGRCQQVKNPG